MGSSLRSRLQAVERKLQRLRFDALTVDRDARVPDEPLPVVLYRLGDDVDGLAARHAVRVILIPDNGRSLRAAAPDAAAPQAAL